MYGKLFASCFTGSMVGSGLNVFAIWGYVIANARSDGYVELNPPLIATILGCSVGEVQAGINVLTSPDPNSRNKKEDGRRLTQESAFLYYVPTYLDYREIRDEEGRKEYMRNYMKEYRKKPVNLNVNTCKHLLANTDTDTDTDTAKSKALVSRKGARLEKPFTLPLDWIEWAKEYNPALNIQVTADSFADYWHGVAGAKGVKLDWFATWRNWVRTTKAQGGNSGQKSKGLNALETLQEMKDGLAQNRDFNRIAETNLLGVGQIASL